MTISTVLAVDDEVIAMRILTAVLSKAGFQVICARDGEEAWEILQSHPGTFDAIILDRVMPRLDGIGLLKRIKQTEAFSPIPVIMQTSLAAKDDVAEGIRAGAYYYIAKPFDGDVLIPIVQAAIRDFQLHRELKQELDRFQHSMTLMQTSHFCFRTLEDAWFLSNLLSNACPEPERMVTGLAELLVNAIEHGNLGIGYHGKSGLTESNSWQSEVNRRLALPENLGKFAEVRFERLPGEICISIEDKGEGFEWQQYLHLDEERAYDDHGRGIAMAKLLSFDHLEYNARGNRVSVMIETPIHSN